MKKGFNNDESAMDGVFVESADIDITDGDRFVFLKRILPDILFVNDTGTNQNPAVNVVVKDVISTTKHFQQTLQHKSLQAQRLVR